MISHRQRDTQLTQIISRQPYNLNLDSLVLQIDKDVFPPDLGFTSQHLAHILKHFHPQTALDMGCGSGYLALILKKLGTPQVYASDIHSPAIDCTNHNIQTNHLSPITVIQSNLFTSIPPSQFDLIVFNQPYYPNTGNTIFGCGKDGGQQITTQFLTQAKSYLTPNGFILMPFSTMAQKIHNPNLIAQSLNFQTKTIFHHHDDIQDHYIYQISL